MGKPERRIIGSKEFYLGITPEVVEALQVKKSWWAKLLEWFKK